jgi:hypothetical protein
MGYMVKSVAKTNQKLVARLYSELDFKAVQSALDGGEITPRQAQNITKLIRTSNVIRESAHRGAVVFDEATSQYVGEVTSKNDGALWIGRRYGRNYPHDSAEFAEQDDAVRFVGTEALHQTVAETKARNAAVPPEEIEAAIEEALAHGQEFRWRTFVLNTAVNCASGPIVRHRSLDKYW